MCTMRSALGTTSHIALVAGLLVALIMTGCLVESGDGEERLVIEDIRVEPPNPTPNTEVDLTGVVQLPPDEALSYEWNAEAGEFLGATTERTAEWRAPRTIGSYEISFTLTDNEENESVSETVVVEVGDD